METPTCETCRFWCREDDTGSLRTQIDVGDGQCRRYPPMIIDAVVHREINILESQRHDYRGGEIEADAIDTYFSAYHPWTDPAHWCGEHQPLEGEG